MSAKVFALPARTDLNPHAPRGEGFPESFSARLVGARKAGGRAERWRVDRIYSRRRTWIAGRSHESCTTRAGADRITDASGTIASDGAVAGREWVQQQYSYEMFRERLRGNFGRRILSTISEYFYLQFRNRINPQNFAMP